MSAGWLMYDVIVVALLAAAAWAVESLCRQLGRPARWSWIAAVVAAVLLVARAALVADASPVGALMANASTVATPLGVAPEWIVWAAVRDAMTIASTAIVAMAAGTARLLPAWVIRAAALVWIAGSVVALVVFTLVHLHIRRARLVWPEAHVHGSRVRIAPDVGPAVVGLLRPEIVIPRWLLGCTADEQRLVLAHESEHLHGRDHLLLAAGCLIVALVPWHPAVWWMLARLRLAIELDCDARVIRRGVSAKAYGTVLIDLAGRCSGFLVGATALADEGSHLERRLLAMNTNRPKRRFLRAGLLGAAAMLALLAACEAKVPTAADVDAMDVASAQRTATKMRMFKSMHGDSTLFFVNGRAVDALTANSLAPNYIATVNISKGKTAADPSMISIITNGESPRRDGRVSSGLVGLHAALQGEAPAAPSKMKIRTPGPDMATALVLIDGVRADPVTMNALDPSSIVSVRVIKGEQATKLSSDPAAKNGIIKVTTKQ